MNPSCNLKNNVFRAASGFALFVKTIQGSTIDDRPSTNQFHQLVRKRKGKRKKSTTTNSSDVWRVTCDTGYVTCGGEGIKIPSSYGLRVKVFWRFSLKRMSKMFVANPRLHRVCQTLKDHKRLTWDSVFIVVFLILVFTLSCYSRFHYLYCVFSVFLVTPFF